MPNVVNFGPEFERNLVHLHEAITEEKSRVAGEPVPERELVKHSLEKLTRAVPVAPVPTPAAPSAPADGSTLPGYLADPATDPRVKEEVQRLVDVAFGEHIEKAIAEAKKHSPFVMDALHDALVDKLIPELKRRGML